MLNLCCDRIDTRSTPDKRGSAIVRVRPVFVSAFAGCIVLAFAAACGAPRTASPTTASPSSTSVARAQAVATLEGQLATLLGEHVALAANATGAALAGRTDEFNAAATELDKNSVALADLIGSVYGTEARDAFLKGWRDHIGFFVDYTQAVATHDDAKKQQALADLDRYAYQLAQFFNAANGDRCTGSGRYAHGVCAPPPGDGPHADARRTGCAGDGARVPAALRCRELARSIPR